MKTRWLIPMMLATTACSSMRPVSSPQSFLAGRSPGVVVVISKDGKATEMSTPKLLADTVFGFNAEGDEVTIPVNTVQSLYAKQINPFRTALVVAGVTVVTAFLATAVLGSGTDTVGDKLPDDLDDFRARQRMRTSTRVPLVRIGIPF
jgi:hypothetical protein